MVPPGEFMDGNVFFPAPFGEEGKSTDTHLHMIVFHDNDLSERLKAMNKHVDGIRARKMGIHVGRWQHAPSKAG